MLKKTVNCIYLKKKKREEFGNSQEVSGQSEDVSLRLKPARMTYNDHQMLSNATKTNWDFGYSEKWRKWNGDGRWAHIKKGHGQHQVRSYVLDARWEKEAGMAQNNLEKDCSKRAGVSSSVTEWGPKLKAAQDWTTWRNTVEALCIAWHEKDRWWNMNK